MIKSQLVARIAAQNPHLYNRDVEKVVNAILTQIVSAMTQGNRVELRGFGAFSVRIRRARTGRDPRTDPQPGDDVRVSGQLRSVIRREGDALWCKDGAISYKTTVQRWKEWCGKSAKE